MRLNDSIDLTIDVAAWMASIGRFSSIKATDREWIAATCPFHDDRHPSFAVNVDHGGYVCQACGASGSFVKLVFHVEGTHDTIFDAEQSLIARYGRFVPDVNEPLTLDFGESEEETFVAIGDILTGLPSSDYLDERGIDAAIQWRFGTYHSAEHNATSLPWFDERLRCVTVKYRSVADKRFWYDPPVSAGRLRRMLYGYHLARNADTIVVVEGEIDAMSVHQAGYAAVALGGSNVSTAQLRLLRNARADEIVVFTDNDEAGRKARTKLVDGLVGYKRVSAVDWSLFDGKDANDVLRRYGVNGIDITMRSRIPIGLTLGV